jgi:hypothetical protein
MGENVVCKEALAASHPARFSHVHGGTTQRGRKPTASVTCALTRGSLVSMVSDFTFVSPSPASLEDGWTGPRIKVRYIPPATQPLCPSSTHICHVSQVSGKACAECTPSAPKYTYSGHHATKVRGTHEGEVKSEAGSTRNSQETQPRNARTESSRLHRHSFTLSRHHLSTFCQGHLRKLFNCRRIHYQQESKKSQHCSEPVTYIYQGKLLQTIDNLSRHRREPS